jgi:hypothetical protein
MGNRYDKNMSVPPARDSWSRTRCPNPRELDRILNHGKLRPDMSADPRHQPPQDPIDRHGKGYHNDVPEHSWLRGDNGDMDSKNGNPNFDAGGSGHRYSGKRS